MILNDKDKYSRERKNVTVVRSMKEGEVQISNQRAIGSDAYKLAGLNTGIQVEDFFWIQNPPERIVPFNNFKSREEQTHMQLTKFTSYLGGVVPFDCCYQDKLGDIKFYPLPRNVSFPNGYQLSVPCTADQKVCCEVYFVVTVCKIQSDHLHLVWRIYECSADLVTHKKKGGWEDDDS